MAGSRETNIEDASFFTVGETIRCRQDEVQYRIIDDAAREPGLTTDQIKDDHEVRLETLSLVNGHPSDVMVGKHVQQGRPLRGRRQ